MRNVINSFSIRKVSCFIEKSPQKKSVGKCFFWGVGVGGGGGDKNTKNEGKTLKQAINIVSLVPGI